MSLEGEGGREGGRERGREGGREGRKEGGMTVIHRRNITLFVHIMYT